MKARMYAPAKLNLVLDVVGKRADGYHDLRTVMQTVDWGDAVTVELTDGNDIALTCDGGIPADEHNTAYRAVELFREYTGLSFGCEVEVHKAIPSQAGMAGGSADAAAVLRALNRLHGGRLSAEQMRQLAERIGADVPFCLQGGIALATGTGSVLQPLPPLPPCWFAVVKPEGGVSTPEAYRLLDEAPQPVHPDVDAFCCALHRQDWDGMVPHMQNSFEAALALPHTANITAQLREAGAKAALMTGSGSAVFGLFLDEVAAAHAVCQLQNQYPVARLCWPMKATADE